MKNGLQTLVVAVCAPFSSYLYDMLLILRDARYVRQVAAEDRTMQIATKTGLEDRSAGVSAHFLREETCGRYYSIV